MQIMLLIKPLMVSLCLINVFCLEAKPLISEQKKYCKTELRSSFICSNQKIIISLSKSKKNLLIKNHLNGIKFKITENKMELLSASFIFNEIKHKENHSYFFITAKYSSFLDTRGVGYCGAGEEVFLLIFEILDNQILLKNKILIESCIESLELVDTIEKSIILLNGKIFIDWLIAPKNLGKESGKGVIDFPFQKIILE